MVCTPEQPACRWKPSGAAQLLSHRDGDFRLGDLGSWVFLARLERFGDIDICHKIGDPREEHPGIIWNPHWKLPDREAFCFPELWQEHLVFGSSFTWWQAVDRYGLRDIISRQHSPEQSWVLFRVLLVLMPTACPDTRSKKQSFEVCAKDGIEACIFVRITSQPGNVLVVVH